MDPKAPIGGVPCARQHTRAAPKTCATGPCVRSARPLRSHARPGRLLPLLVHPVRSTFSSRRRTDAGIRASTAPTGSRSAPAIRRAASARCRSRVCRGARCGAMYRMHQRSSAAKYAGVWRTMSTLPKFSPSMYPNAIACASTRNAPRGTPSMPSSRCSVPVRVRINIVRSSCAPTRRATRSP